MNAPTHAVRGLAAGGQQLPAELRARKQWLIARPDAQGAYKVPTSINEYGTLIDGDSTDSGNWLTFEQACAGAAHYGLGIGYVLSKDDPYTVIDLDVKNQVNAPDKPEKWTPREQVDGYWRFATETTKSYTETSISGQGLHIFVKGKIGRGIKKDGFELYSQDRFVVCTGNAVLPYAIEDRESLVLALAADLRARQGSNSRTDLDASDGPNEHEDAAILEMARSAANREKFEKLYAGEWEDLGYPSQSEADMALMSMFTFYSRNNEQCRRLFRTSALGQRAKAMKDDRYLNLTLSLIRCREASERAAAMEMKERWERMKQIGDGSLPNEPTPVLELEQMLSDFVFIVDQSQVAQLSRPGSLARFTDMRNYFAASASEVKGAKGKPVRVPTIDLWLKDDRRLGAETVTFDPRYGRFCVSPDGRRALNLFVPRHHVAPQAWAEMAKPFFEHIEYLVPEPVERSRFLDWLAHIEQRPGELPHFGFIMVALRQGVGRNWMAAVLAQVWRGHVALDFDLKQVLDKGFNGRLSRKLLAVTDEINEGKQGDQWQHAEKLKSMVTTTERHINPKYGAERVELNCCRWLLFSNHISAIPLTDKDRRWFVVRNPEQPRPTAYYRDLYAALEQPQFIASVRQAFLVRDISAFNPGEKPEMNEAKRDMVEAATSEASEALAELIRSHPADVIAAPDLGRALYGEDLRPGDQRPFHRANDAGLSRWKGTGDGRLRLAGYPNPLKVMVLRNPERWVRADTDAIRQELARGYRPVMVPPTDHAVPGVPGVPALIKA